MSAMYYKVTPEPPLAETYGFKKVNQGELRDIIFRLTKPTYNSQIHQGEAYRAHNYRHVHSAPPPRTPSYCHRRVSTGSQSGKLNSNRKLTERELERLFRRIQKPTRAHQVSRKDYEPSDSSVRLSRPTTASRPVTATERKKAFYQLSRPTTASRGKNNTECHLCDETDRELNKKLVPFQYPYADDKSVTMEEANSIVSRISSPTKASEKGASECFKSPPDYSSVHMLSAQLPLVSGLPRSKNVSQIVNRLHYNQRKTRNFHGYSTQATPVTNFEAWT